MTGNNSGTVVILVKKSLIARVRGALGTEMFRTLYARVDGEVRDICDNGDRSCALFVSTVLVGLHLIKEVHASVSGTVQDLESSGWTRLRRPRSGCVVVWDVVNDVGRRHDHIGFYMGRGSAISNSSKEGVPREHPYQVHRVKALYWTSRLV